MPSLITTVILIFQAVCVAANAALYAAHGKPISLGATIFCAAMFLVTLVGTRR